MNVGGDEEIKMEVGLAATCRRPTLNTPSASIFTANQTHNSRIQPNKKSTKTKATMETLWESEGNFNSFQIMLDCGRENLNNPAETAGLF